VITPHPAVALYAEHMNPAFVKLLGAFGYGRVFVSARGTMLRDHEGREYLDFLAGFGATNLGHNHPRLTEALRAALLEDLPGVVHAGPQVHAAELASELCARVPFLPMCLFSSSGAEAVETGLKLARAFTRRPGIVYCEGSYHGLSMGALSITGAARMRAPFAPLLSDCHPIPFGDLAALERALSRHRVGAFVVEPILGEGGAVIPKSGYLAAARELCHRKGALLILDEVQTGLGRTGALFAHQVAGLTVEPDVLVLGKSLGGSLVPISATLTTRAIHARAFGTAERFDLHGSTYAGSALACRAALETLRILDAEDLVKTGAAKGRRLLAGLAGALEGHPMVRSVRGRGLLVGVELGPTDRGVVNRVLPGMVRGVSRRVFGQWLAVRLLEQGIVAQPASQRWDVLKLTPPLTVSDAEIDRVVAAIAGILDGYRDLGPLLRDVAVRLGRQLGSGWSFG
jgi:putrescine aminotransferase